MRRLHGGLLAAALLLVAGCGPGESDGDAAAEPQATVRTPTLAVTSQVISASRPAEVTITVLVTSPEGVASPGLDAAVAVLLDRPDVTVVVVAPPDATASWDGRNPPAIRPGETMSGFPAHVVDAPADEAIAIAITELGVDPDLVLSGVVEGAVLGSGIDPSATARVVRAAGAHGIPALAVTVGTHHGADFAAAGLMLRSMLDVDLDTLLSPGGRVLTVPSCDGGLVRGPVSVDASIERSVPPVVVCGAASSGEPADDAEAHSRGIATVVALDG